MNIILTEKKENIIDNTKSYKIITPKEIKKIEKIEYDKIIILLYGNFTINSILPDNSNLFSLASIKPSCNNEFLESLYFPVFEKKTFDFCYKVFEEDFIINYFNYLQPEAEIKLEGIELKIKNIEDLKRMADAIISTEDKSNFKGIFVDSKRIFALLNFIEDDDLLFKSFEYLYHDFFKDRPFFKELKKESNLAPLPFTLINFAPNVNTKLYNKYNFVLDVDTEKESEFLRKKDEEILKEREKRWESQ